MATKLTLLAGLLFVAACANDTGNPKELPTLGPTVVPPSSRGTLPPIGGSVAQPPITPMVDDFACSMIAQANSRGLVTHDCIDCTCQTNPHATEACSSGCWSLLACVSMHCATTDTSCILRECAADLGGNANIASVAPQAMATPFFECGAKCSLPRANADDAEAGVDNDF
jgi:hypothetical protein